jgi:hypothetical protein
LNFAYLDPGRYSFRHGADGHDDRLPEMAADLVRHHVAVIATPLSTQAAIAVPT